MKEEKLSNAERRALVLQHWPDLAKKTPTAIVGRLWRAADHVRNFIAPRIRRYGVQVADFQVLFILRIYGPPYALSPTIIYRAQCCSSGGLTKILQRLKQANLIERYTNPDDKRNKLVRLTPKGKRVVEIAMNGVAQLEATLLTHFNKHEKEMLTRLLDKLLAKI